MAAATAGAAMNSLFIKLPALSGGSLNGSLPSFVTAMLSEAADVASALPNAVHVSPEGSESQHLLCSHAALMRVRSLPHADENAFERQLLGLQVFEALNSHSSNRQNCLHAQRIGWSRSLSCLL